MSDLKQYIDKRTKVDSEFAIGYDVGYEEFKLGVLLKELRLQTGLTQEQLAERINTKKTVVSRMENHSEDMRLSTLSKVVEAFGKKLQIVIR
jgi:ribosome-binding protein aMBF1 (putative translation factor)